MLTLTQVVGQICPITSRLVQSCLFLFTSSNCPCARHLTHVSATLRSDYVFVRASMDAECKALWVPVLVEKHYINAAIVEKGGFIATQDSSTS